MTTNRTEEAMQAIADTLNSEAEMDEIDRCSYNHFERFEELCAERGLDVDYERQDQSDPVAAYELFAENGWALVLSGGAWCVSEPDDLEDAVEAGMCEGCELGECQ